MTTQTDEPTTTMTTTTSFPSTTIPTVIVSVDDLIAKFKPEVTTETSTNIISTMTSKTLPDNSTQVTPKSSELPLDSPIDRGTTSSAPTSTSMTMKATTTRKTTTTEKVIQMTIYSNTQSTISRRSGAPPTEVTTWSFTKSTRFTPNQPSDHSGLCKFIFLQSNRNFRAEHRKYRGGRRMRGCNFWSAIINNRCSNVS